MRSLFFLLSCLRTGRCLYPIQASLSLPVAATDALYKVVGPSGTLGALCRPTRSLVAFLPCRSLRTGGWTHEKCMKTAPRCRQVILRKGLSKQATHETHSSFPRICAIQRMPMWEFNTRSLWILPISCEHAYAHKICYKPVSYTHLTLPTKRIV